MSIEQQVQKQISVVLNQKLRSQLNILREKCKQILRQSIKENVYDIYHPTSYQRTFEMLNAVDVSEIEFRGNELYFKVFVNVDKMHHESIFNPELDPNVGYLVNEGHHHPVYETPMFHQYPGRHFIEAAIIEIKNELHKYINEFIGNVYKIPGKPLR